MKRIAFFILCLSFLQCPKGRLWSPFAKMTDIDPCDPASNVYEGDDHYVERDFINEDGELDYDRWFKSRKMSASECDPLNRTGQHIPEIDRPRNSEKIQAPQNH